MISLGTTGPHSHPVSLHTSLLFRLSWCWGAGAGGGRGCLKGEGAFGERRETYIHLIQVTCLSLFFSTTILRRAETTHSELENFPHETGKSGVKITAEKQKWPEKCLALVYRTLDFLLCSKFEENDRKGRGYSFPTTKNVRGAYSQ